jgi:hypothetical protein
VMGSKDPGHTARFMVQTLAMNPVVIHSHHL